MSRAYRISVSESLKRSITVEDGIASQLELLEILPRRQMAELLAAELERIGFEREGDRLRRVDQDGLELEVELESGRLTVRVADQAEIELSDSASGLSGRGPQDPELKQRLKAQLRKSLEEKVAEQQEQLRQQLSARLERKLADLSRELDGALGRATGEALKEKARQLGEVEEISEGEDGSLTIRVRV